MKPSPGQVVALVFPPGPEAPLVKRGENAFPVFPCPVTPGWCGLMPVPLDAEGKTFSFEVSSRSESKTVQLALSPATYGSERLRVDPARVKLSPKNLKRVQAEREVFAKIYGAPPTALQWDGAFERPGKGKVNSPFGRARVFNGVRQGFHTGVDLDGNSKTPILAANAGTVVLRGNFFFAGNLLIVDHGQNIFTIYAHLSRFSVKQGQQVAKGQRLGYVGATGRVTGPHLHFAVRVGGVLGDPLQMFEVVNPWWKPAGQEG